MKNKKCPVCGRQIPERGWGWRSHMVAHARVGEAVIMRGAVEVTLAEYNARRSGERYDFRPAKGLVHA